MYIAGSNAELDNITRYELLEKESFIKHVSTISHVRRSITLSLQGTHVFMTGGVFSGYQEMAKAAGKAWYRSKETVPIQDPFVGGGFLSNKKWPLIEECTYHEFTVENFYS